MQTRSYANGFRYFGPLFEGWRVLNSAPYVRKSVRPSVTRFFLIFWIKFMVQNTKKSDRARFFGKTPVGPNLGKRSQKWPKNGFFQHFLKIESLLLAGNRLKCWTSWLGCMVHHPGLGKLFFGHILGKLGWKLSINQIASFSKCSNF